MTHSDTGIGNKRGFGQELKDTRLRRGLSQAKLAVILTVSVAAISRWEHGNRSPRVEHSQQIQRWLQQVGQ